MFSRSHNKRLSKTNAYPAFTAPPRGPAVDDFSDEHCHGFIHHPERCPIQTKVLRRWERKKNLETEEPCSIGLIITSAKYRAPGAVLEITIPTRKDVQKFTCKVVLIRANKTGYETGLWLMRKRDEQRIRIVEQICHIELYLDDKRRRDGPFLSQEKITEEWITKFAARFPIP